MEIVSSIFWLLLFIVPFFALDIYFLASEAIATSKHQQKPAKESIWNSMLKNFGVFSFVSAFLSIIICGIIWIVLVFYNFPVIYTVNSEEKVTKAFVIWRDKDYTQYEHNGYYLRNCTSDSLCEISASYGPSYAHTYNPIILQNTIPPKHVVELKCVPVSIMNGIPENISVRKNRFSSSNNVEHRTCIMNSFKLL